LQCFPSRHSGSLHSSKKPPRTPRAPSCAFVLMTTTACIFLGVFGALDGSNLDFAILLGRPLSRDKSRLRTALGWFMVGPLGRSKLAADAKLLSQRYGVDSCSWLSGRRNSPKTHWSRDHGPECPAKILGIDYWCNRKKRCKPNHNKHLRRAVGVRLVI